LRDEDLASLNSMRVLSNAPMEILKSTGPRPLLGSRLMSYRDCWSTRPKKVCTAFSLENGWPLPRLMSRYPSWSST
jgi:hypothetical protein